MRSLCRFNFVITLEVFLGCNYLLERAWKSGNATRGLFFRQKVKTLHVSLIILAGLVFSEYLLSGQAPPVKDVNDEEPLFPAVPILNATFANKVS